MDGMLNSPPGGTGGYPFSHQQHQQHQLYPPSTTASRHSSSPSKGPRAQCDEVVFEAIAKAAEIVVASRCWIGEGSSNINSNSNSNNTSNGGSPSPSSTGSGSSILHRWKKTMHVPLRLDVYYQHPPTATTTNTNANPHDPSSGGGERELLERWCLEYAPSTTNNGMPINMNSPHSVDPIVQLRTVCKNIIVWLRTLYCHSRMLPAQALRPRFHSHSHCGISSDNNIGFSIYVVSEGRDDVSGLLQQGFDSAPTPTIPGGVPTPYGVVGWKVYMAPRDTVRKLVALEEHFGDGRSRALQLQQQQQQQQQKQLPYRTSPSATMNNDSTRYSSSATTTTTTTRSIPMRVGQPSSQHQQQQQFAPQSYAAYSSTPPTTTSSPSRPQLAVARSAPGRGLRGYRRSHSSPVGSDALHSGHDMHMNTNTNTNTNIYHHNGNDTELQMQMQMRSRTLAAPRSYHHNTTLLQRRNTEPERPFPNRSSLHAQMAPPAPSSGGAEKSPAQGGGSDGGGIGGGKNLSGLSLALMQDPQQPQQQPQQQQPTPEEIAASEKRRAALHYAPPSATGVGEYGYAYNHQAYDEATATATPPPYSSSFPRGPSTPSAGITPGTTPPGYLLSGTPSLGSYMGAGGLLPPARASASSTAHPGTSPTGGGGASLAPPFVRPLGFSGHTTTESAAKSVTSAATAAQRPATNGTSTSVATARVAGGATGQAPSGENDHKPSLDLLHSSPFHGIVGGSSYPRDGLSSYLQADENASMAAATTYIQDFYHHHYHHHHPLGGDETDGDHHGHQYLCHDPGSSVAAAGALSSPGAGGEVFDGSSDHYLYHNPDYAGGLVLDADMPFAVDGISSLSVAPNQHAGASASSMPSLQASLVASVGMAAPKRLAMFESKNKHNNNNNNNNHSAVHDPGVQQTQSQNPSHPLSNNNNNNPSDDTVVDSLADQLADFKSFGASLMATSGVGAAPAPLTASVGSGG
eukprot:jgi/Psemu1/16013/gm1.16013_g